MLTQDLHRLRAVCDLQALQPSRRRVYLDGHHTCTMCPERACVGDCCWLESLTSDLCLHLGEVGGNASEEKSASDYLQRRKQSLQTAMCIPIAQNAGGALLWQLWGHTNEPCLTVLLIASLALRTSGWTFALKAIVTFLLSVPILGVSARCCPV